MQGCRVLLDGCEYWRSVAGRWRGASFVGKVSLLTAGRNSDVGKARKFVSDHGRVTSVYHRHNTLSPPQEVGPDTDTSAGGLGGPLLSVGLLLGPAEVALHLHKFWRVFLFLLIFLLLQLQLL